MSHFGTVVFALRVSDFVSLKKVRGLQLFFLAQKNSKTCLQKSSIQYFET